MIDNIPSLFGNSSVKAFLVDKEIMANISVARIKREFKEVVKSEEVSMPLIL